MQHIGSTFKDQDIEYARNRIYSVLKARVSDCRSFNRSVYIKLFREVWFMETFDFFSVRFL